MKNLLKISPIGNSQWIPECPSLHSHLPLSGLHMLILLPWRLQLHFMQNSPKNPGLHRPHLPVVTSHTLEFNGGQDLGLQNPQLPCPSMCSKFSLTFVEHQCLLFGSWSVMHSCLRIPLNFQGNLHWAFLSGLSLVVKHWELPEIILIISTLL